MNTVSRIFSGREWTQSILVVALMAAIIYMSVVGQEIPDILTVAFSTALGFFFGAKVNNSTGVG